MLQQKNSTNQVLRLQSSDFPRVLKGNGYLQTIHRLLPFSSTGPSSMSQAVLKQLSSNLLIKTGLLMPYNHLWSLLRPVHKEADLFDMDATTMEDSSSTQISRKGNSDKKGDKCGTNTYSVYKAVVKAPYSLKMRVEPSSFEIQHNHPPESFPSNHLLLDSRRCL
ncbi:hypothetical protein QYF36_010172 [Acer negundo]|nr:hypothetical protein QYF36_010172 [Acer negundo]